MTNIVKELMIAMLESQLKIKKATQKIADAPKHQNRDNYYIITAEIDEIKSQLKELKS